MEKVKQVYWMIVWNSQTGDFKNAIFNSDHEEDKALEEFQQLYPDLKVIHIGEGVEPPRTYRSLPYI